MPRCDGVAATRLIKPVIEMKIVMLTMAAEGEVLFGAAGASGYLLSKA